jgi:hypothetical protein
MSKISLVDLRALLAAEKADALSAMSASKLSEERSRALDYYLGDMSRDMPAPEGRSKAVSSDVADTIEGLMPTLMEIFCGGDEVVRFDATEPGFSSPLFLHQGCTALQGRHRQGVVGDARGDGARDLLRSRRCGIRDHCR